MHRSTVRLDDVNHNYNFQRKFNLCNAHNTIGSVILFKVPLLCSLDIKLADNISNLNDQIV